MANSFMQQYPRPSRTQHHHHFSCRSFVCLKIDQSLAHRLFGVMSDKRIIRQAINGETATTTAAALFLTTIALYDHVDAQSDHRAYIRCQDAIAAGNQNQILDSVQAGHDFTHARIGCSGDLVDSLEQADLVFGLER